MGTLIGSAANDVLTGYSGDDTIDGLAGADTMSGGTGNDTYVVDNAGDKVIEAPGGGDYDTIQSSISLSAVAANVEYVNLIGSGDLAVTGNSGANNINGNSGANHIDGGAGDDYLSGYLGPDTLVGGAGNDILIANNYFSSNDTSSNNLDGGAGNDWLYGDRGDDVLTGGAGNDVISGGVGADAMTGGAGDDTYYVDNSGDTVNELPNQGTDTIYSTINFNLATLAPNVENLIVYGGPSMIGVGNALNNAITGQGTTNELYGAAGNDTLTGSTGHDALYGNEGNDVLNGGGGADGMIGGIGNDTYYVDDPGDSIIENTSEGVDLVISDIDYKLGNDLDNLTLRAGNIDGTGNELANVITGSSGDNTLTGLDGNDTLIGGLGNDTYNLSAKDGADKIVEAAGQGDDSVHSALAAYTLGSNLENLYFDTGALDGKGNTLNNEMFGNAAANTIDGDAGNDLIFGNDGPDTLTGGAGNDTLCAENYSYTGDAGVANTLDGGTGNDILHGAAGNDSLIGGTGDDNINGHGGSDVMTGGAGNDIYSVDDAGDQVIEKAGQGHDTVYSDIDFDLGVNGTNVEDLFLSGAAHSGRGNDLDNEIIGGSGDDTLTGLGGNDYLAGGSGNDVMTGGAGNDTYQVDSADDKVTEAPGEGIDTVVAFIDYTLGDNIENLQLGYYNNDLHGTGNAQDNIITGGQFDDILTGGAGKDTLVGSTGDDTYILAAGDAQDKIVEAANQGNDWVYSALASYTLGSNLEALLISTGGSDGKGNALDNELVGNTGQNTLNGDSGNDIIWGNNGADMLIGGAGNDTLSGENYLFTGDAGVTNTLDGGAGNDWLDGADGNDQLIGGIGDDHLDGHLGADTMTGGAGNDDYMVDNAGDQVVEQANQGTDTVYTAIDFDLSTSGANVENLVLLAGTHSAHGNALANQIIGNSGDDTLHGGSGNDTLIGKTGDDTLYGEDGNDVLNQESGSLSMSGDEVMYGGAGNDTYYIDSTGDKVNEAPDQGTDLVFSYIDYQLTDNVENLTLGYYAAAKGTGNGLDNIITGSHLDDTLTGGAGNDTLIGGYGNDTYQLQTGDQQDKIVEAANQGEDKVQVWFSGYTLAANLEDLELVNNATAGTGNKLDNLMFANTIDSTLDGDAGNDTLTGYNGADTLIGGAGNDSLDGGTGADKMSGGAGNDTYYVDDASDTVIESPNQGFDTIHSTLDFNLALHGANVEQLVLEGTAVTGTGNDLDNVILGNAENNVLAGGKGDDTLDGGGGTDAMTGGAGDDTYYVDNSADSVTELSGEGIDLIIASSDYTLRANVENLTIESTVGHVGDGNELANTIKGGSGDDSLWGDAGNDTLIGGLGDDTYILAVGDDHDKITEATGQGIDTVQSYLDHYTLGANLEDLTLQGGALEGTGNALDNTINGDGLDNVLDGQAGNDRLISGNGADTLTGGTGDDYLSSGGADDHLDGGAGNDALDGGAGNDMMIGGAGNDIYYVDSAGDVIVEQANQGHDIVFANLSFDLSTSGKNVEDMVVTGGNVTGIGNDLDNWIISGGGNDTLAGGKGADTLLGADGNDFLNGGEGNDVLNGGHGQDSLTGGAGSDLFLFTTNSSLDLGAEIGDTIQDFQTGQDKIDLRDIFDDFAISSSADPFADGHLALQVSGGNTLLQFDGDGGGNNYVTIATVIQATVATTDIVY